MRLRDLLEAETASRPMYHGSYAPGVLRSVMKSGLQGRVDQGRHSLSPIKGRVYMTPSLRYAIIYAIGGDMLSHKQPADRIKPGERYGYVFEIDPNQLSDDLIPDEDIVGDALTAAYEIHHKGTHNPYSEMDKELLQHPDLVRKLAYLFDIFTRGVPMIRKGAIEGMLSAHARLGKRVLKHKGPGDLDMKALMQLNSAHQSHGGNVMPVRAWRIDRRLTHKLTKDGSNFFDIAQLVWDRTTRPISETALDEMIGYHGSSMEQPQFLARHTGVNSTVFGNYDMDRTGIFFSNNPNFSKLYGRVGRYKLNIKRPAFDLKELAYRLSMEMDAFGPERHLWQDIKTIALGSSIPEWHLFDGEVGEKFVAWLISQGYDSARFEESIQDDHDVEHESYTTVVFDPKNIVRLPDNTKNQRVNA